MKESRLYLNFFKKNLLLLLLPVVLFSILGFYIQSAKSIIYSRTRILETDIFEEDVTKKVTLTDQAVSTTRSANVLSTLQISPNVEITLFKSAPLTVNLTASSRDPLPLKQSLDKVSVFLEEKYKLETLGQDTESINRPNLLYGTFLGAVMGALCGVIISLIKTYFRIY